MIKKRRKKTLTLQPATYQPSKAELERKVKINATPDELATAVMQDVRIRRSKNAPK